MKRLMGIVAMAFMFSVLLCNQGFSATVVGQLATDSAARIKAVTLTFFDSGNAELIATTTPDAAGFFRMELEPGQYKIHSYWNEGDFCLAEFYNASADGQNVFDSGVTVTVVDGINDLDRVLIFIGDKPFPCGPVLCGPKDGSIIGFVSDGSGVGIPGILVQFKDPVTAFESFPETRTDLNGLFDLIPISPCQSFEVKIRFSDLNGIFRSEYYGATNDDDFAMGEVAVFESADLRIADSLAKLPPAEQVADIIDDIIAVLPPGDAQPVVNSLNQAQDLLLDANPNNDKGACGILTGTTNKLKDLVADGGLLQEEADPLLASIDATKTDLGCKK